MNEQPRRQRRVSVYALLAVASLIGFLAVFAVWANRQLLETNTWTDTSSKLLEDEEIRTQVASTMVDVLYANVDVRGELEQALPPRLQPLAGAAAAGVRELSLKLANQALERPQVQQLWEDANRSAQETLVDVVRHGGDEDVNLNLGEIVDELGTEIGVDVSGKIPPGAAEIDVLPNDKLSAAQKVVKALRGAAFGLTLLAILLFALAIYLARGWRREALRTVGFALIGIGLLVLFLRSLIGDRVVDSLASTESVQPAATNAWSIGTSLLKDQGSATILYGLVIVLGAWLSGPGAVARSARRGLTPFLHRRSTAYFSLGLILILLFWWAPTPGFHRLPTAITLVVLLVIGLEFLRRQAVADFPDETWEKASERWGSSLRRRFGSG